MSVNAKTATQYADVTKTRYHLSLQERTGLCDRGNIYEFGRPPQQTHRPGTFKNTNRVSQFQRPQIKTKVGQIALSYKVLSYRVNLRSKTQVKLLSMVAHAYSPSTGETGKEGSLRLTRCYTLSRPKRDPASKERNSIPKNHAHMHIYISHV